MAGDAQTRATLASCFLESRVAAKAHFVKNGLQLAIGPGIVASGAFGRRRTLLKLCFIQYIIFVLVPVVAVQAIEIVHVLLMGETNGVLARVAEYLAVIQQNFIWLSPQGFSQNQPRDDQACHVFGEWRSHKCPFGKSHVQVLRPGPKLNSPARRIRLIKNITIWMNLVKGATTSRTCAERMWHITRVS